MCRCILEANCDRAAPLPTKEALKNDPDFVLVIVNMCRWKRNCEDYGEVITVNLNTNISAALLVVSDKRIRDARKFTGDYR